MSNPVAEPILAGSRKSAAPARPLITNGDVGQLIEPVTQWIVRNPSAALASAFFVGVIVAWWIKRR